MSVLVLLLLLQSRVRSAFFLWQARHWPLRDSNKFINIDWSIDQFGSSTNHNAEAYSICSDQTVHATFFSLLMHQSSKQNGRIFWTAYVIMVTHNLLLENGKNSQFKWLTNMKKWNADKKQIMSERLIIICAHFGPGDIFLPGCKNQCLTIFQQTKRLF